MIDLAITSNTSQTEKALKAYAKRAPVALMRALNRGITGARTVMVREIARDTGMKSKDVRDALTMRLATPDRLQTRLAASLKRVPLIDFKGKSLATGVSFRTRGAKRGGVTVRLPSAFIATMSNSHRGIFKRRGRKRLPIKELFGPSLGHVFLKYKPAAVARGRELFQTNLEHELAFDRELPSGTGASDD